MTVITNSPPVDITPRDAQVALAVIEALTDRGGTVQATADASVSQQLVDQIAERVDDRAARQYRKHPAGVLDPLARVGAVTIERTGEDRRTAMVRVSLDPSALDLLPFLTERAAQAGLRGLSSPRGKALRAQRGGVTLGDMILDELARGPVVDESGRAVGCLAQRVGQPYGGVAQAMRTLRQRGLLVTEGNTRRTHRIALAPSTPAEAPVSPPEALDEVEATDSSPEPSRAQVEAWAAIPGVSDDEVGELTVPVVDELEVERIEVGAPAAADVAVELLRLVIERATAAIEPDKRLDYVERELAEARLRLAQATEYAAVERRRAREAGDELVAVKGERDTLRKRLLSVEANLTQLMRANGSQATAAFRDGVQHALNGLMRELPRLGKAGA